MKKERFKNGRLLSWKRFLLRKPVSTGSIDFFLKEENGESGETVYDWK
jgi:hypothetical protein